MKEPMTLEQFRQKHPNDVIQIMSPGGYVTLPPDRPTGSDIRSRRREWYGNSGLLGGTQRPDR